MRGAKLEGASDTCGGALRLLQELYGGTLRFVNPFPMPPIATVPAELLKRPKRADALRNYEKVLTAAREAFAEGGEATALEEIARRAGVGIGTLYRHFPNRQALLEALYVGEVEEVCRSATEFSGAEPWDALNGWIGRLVGYIGTKLALASELQNYLDHDAALFATCRESLWSAGEPLLVRAQEAGEVRDDVTIGELIQLVVGIVKIPSTDPAQVEHILRVALDGLRYRA
jgi:AcrR family transcriptional regulator